jgi:hypothetical protein
LIVRNSCHSSNTKYKIIIFLIGILCAIFLDNVSSQESREFSTSQLPLSNVLLKFFPNLKSKSFVVASLESRLILHEKNPLTIVSGRYTFDLCTGANIQRLQERKIQFYYDQNTGDSCVFYYRNKNSCVFICALSGASSQEALLADMKLLSKWLDQFFIYKILQQQELVSQIPVFYGMDSRLEIRIPENHKILLSERHNNNVTRIFRYRTALAAPVQAGDIVGWVFYKSVIFQNPTIKEIRSDRNIEKANWLCVLLDSAMYLIFGRPFKV